MFYLSKCLRLFMINVICDYVSPDVLCLSSVLKTKHVSEGESNVLVLAFQQFKMML